MNIIEFVESLKIDNKRTETDFKLYDFQKEILDILTNNSKVAILSARQMGKSSLIFSYALYYSLEESNRKTVIFGIQTDAYDNILKNSKHIKYNKNNNLIKFDNGSTIQIVTKKNEIFTTTDEYDLKIYDESAFIDRKMRKYADKICSRNIVHISTRGAYNEPFMELFRQSRDGKNDYCSAVFDWKKDPTKANIEWLEKQYDSITKECFNLEYSCKI